MSEKDLYDISEVCDMLDTTSRTLRFYEEKGIISSTNDGFSSRRKYTEEQISHIKNVLVLRTLGLSVKEISQLQQRSTDLRSAVISKRAEIISLIDKRTRDINILNEAIAIIESGENIFDINLQTNLCLTQEKKKIVDECSAAIISGDTDDLYKHFSTRMTLYMPRDVYETARREIMIPLGDFISPEKVESDNKYPNKIYSLIQYSNLGLKITFVFHNQKIDGLWLGYYDTNAR